MKNYVFKNECTVNGQIKKKNQRNSQTKTVFDDRMGWHGNINHYITHIWRISICSSIIEKSEQTLRHSPAGTVLFVSTENPRGKETP